jgi:hypothetical protein
MVQNNKFLVIVVGIPRGGNRVYRSIYKHLLKPLDSDLALCSEEKYLQNNYLKDKAKYLWTIPDYSDWNEYYKKFRNGNYAKYFQAGVDTGLENSGKIHFAIKDIILNNHIKILEKYKFIIYTRFDQIHISNHKSEFDENKIYIQEGEDYGGINDRHSVFASKYAKKFLDICSYIDSEKGIRNVPKHPNCERVLNQFLIDNGLTNIERFRRYQFTVLKTGDVTRWRIPTYKIHLSNKLFFKYPEEFLVSFKNSIKKSGILMSSIKTPVLSLNYLLLRIRKKYSKFIPKVFKNFYRNRLNNMDYFQKI